MSIRTILAPGVQINEIDKSQYSPAMTGSNCYVMGFTDRGEPYQPMEFTSRAAWTNYYGTPDNEAERYAYAAACEVLNQNGRLYFARLPYDNAAFEKVACFKYSVRTGKTISADFDEATGKPKIVTDEEGNKRYDATPFWEILRADSTVDKLAAIEPQSSGPALYDLSAIDEYRTDEAKVANNTFLIADISFNTYGKITEDTRKNDRREMIGIMPVVTTAANAMHAQSLIEVDKENVIGYETIGAIKTLDVTTDAALVSAFPKLSGLSSNTVLSGDMAKLVNTRNWYEYVGTLQLRVNNKGDGSSGFAQVQYGDSASQASQNVSAHLSALGDYVTGSWDGSVQRNSDTSCAMFSYKKAFTYDSLCAFISNDVEFEKTYAGKFGWHNPGGDDSVPDTVSQEANSYFPTVEFDGSNFVRDNLKKIGVVVYKMFLDPSEGNKINFEPVEAYAGSLCKTDKDPNTGATTFIDTIINSQSQYINFFSNCFSTAKDRKYYAEELDILAVQPGAAHPGKVEFDINYVKDFPPAIDILARETGISLAECTRVQNITVNTDVLDKIIRAGETTSGTLGIAKDKLDALKELVKVSSVADTVAPSLGFYAEMTREEISISKSIYDGVNKCFQKVEDVNQLDIDIIPDAGIANIASYLKALYGDKGEYDLAVTDDVGNSLLGMWKCNANNAAVKTWKTVAQKLDNFCKNVRKDCMFILDGPRPLVLAGQKKIVRPSKPANTIDANIVPNLKWITGLNTSYGACYVDWFEQADDYSGDFFWCPPSIKAMGVYVNTDVNFNYWDAPAGLNRGVIAATDVAFSPTVKQAGCFYEKNFNYAINYPQDGIVLEGQKTLQTKPSAFDRVNVRRLFCRLERMSYKVARYFIYEGNTSYTRQRLVDALDPYFKEAMVGGGIYSYRIKCDETNNTDITIDNNELHVAIGIKPVKTAEFIMLDFVCLRTGGSWTEAGF